MYNVAIWDMSNVTDMVCVSWTGWLVGWLVGGRVGGWVGGWGGEWVGG